MNPSDCYNTHWPIVRGQLNMHTGPGGSLSATLADLETIWSHVIQKQLDIPIKDLKVGGGDTSFGNMHIYFVIYIFLAFQYYRCILLVPDIYNRQHIKEVVNMLLLNMGFSGIDMQKCVNIHVPFSVEWLIHVSFLSSHSLVCA